MVPGPSGFYWHCVPLIEYITHDNINTIWVIHELNAMIITMFALVNYGNMDITIVALHAFHSVEIAFHL